MKRTVPIVATALLIAASSAQALDLLSLTSEWTPILISGNSDPVADNQANSGDIELVGDPSQDLHAFYVKFDDNGSASMTDGTLGFRIRVAADKAPAGFKGYSRIGVDVDGGGHLEFFISAELDDFVTIIEAGLGSNTGPSTSSLGATLVSNPATASNYSWTSVESIDGVGTDLDGGGDPDYFLSYSINFADLVALASVIPGNEGFNDTFGLRYVAITSQNANNLNSDIGGVDNNNFDPTLSWEDLGVINLPVDAYGNPVVPEPGSCALVFGLIVAPFVLRRRS